MTPLQRHLPREEMIAFGLDGRERQAQRPGFKTPEQGASTSVWAALGEELEGVGGLYLENCAEATPFDAKIPMADALALDPEAERLVISEETTGVVKAPA